MSVSRYEFFRERFLDDGDQPFVRLEDRKVLTRAEFFGGAIRFLNALVDQGVRHGDSVVICLDNRAEYLQLMLALAIGGMVAYPVDPQVSTVQFNKIKQISGASLVITAYSQLAQADDDKVRNVGVPACALQGDMDCPYLVVFSSGTTGMPKGIVQSAANFFNAAGAFAATLGLGRGSLTLHNWPMFYNAGLFNLFAVPLMAGGCIAIGKRFSAKHMDQFWQDIELFKPEWVYLSPTMAASLTKTFRFFNHAPDILRDTRVVTTSSILYPSVRKEFLALFGVALIPCFGITELGGSFTVGDENSPDFSVGRLIENVTVEIDTSHDGELLVSTPYMALGYLGEDGALHTFDRSVPFRTGDLGTMSGGELFVSGRRKDAIKKGGEFISLAEIEDLVLGSGLCSECAAVGRPDVFWGEVYDLFFVPNSPDEKITARDAITRHLNHLPATQRPALLEAVDEIPKTSSGKPLKRLIKYGEATGA